MTLTSELSTAAISSGLPEGRWRVDADRSELSFQARGTFGLFNGTGGPFSTIKGR